MPQMQDTGGDVLPYVLGTPDCNTVLDRGLQRNTFSAAVVPTSYTQIGAIGDS